MKQRSRFGIVAVLVLVVVLLCGCVDIHQEITLKAGENWSAVVDVRFPKSTVDQIGAEEMTVSQEDFEEGRAEAEAKGVKAEFDVRTEDNGDVVWKITYSGQGLALLNETLFEGTTAFTAGADGRVKFSYDPGDMTSMTSVGGNYTFVLKVGKVYSSNATEAKGGTLTWTNPTAPMEAEFGGAGGGGFPVWLIVVLAVVLLAIVAVVLLYLRGKQVKTAAAPVFAPAAPVVPPVAPAVPTAAPVAPVAPAVEPVVTAVEPLVPPVEPLVPPSEPPAPDGSAG